MSISLGFLEGSILNLPLPIVSSPFFRVNSSPEKIRRCSSASSCKFPPASAVTAFQVPWSFSLSFFTSSFGASAPSNRPNTMHARRRRITNLLTERGNRVERGRTVPPQRSFAARTGILYIAKYFASIGTVADGEPHILHGSL